MTIAEKRRRDYRLPETATEEDLGCRWSNVVKYGNRVILARDEELFSSVLFADNINLISVPEIKGEMRVKAKVRYRHREDDATVRMESGLLRVEFDRPQRAITKGQAVVLYDGETVVGGGRICGTVNNP